MGWGVCACACARVCSEAGHCCFVFISTRHGNVRGHYGVTEKMHHHYIARCMQLLMALKMFLQRRRHSFSTSLMGGEGPVSIAGGNSSGSNNSSNSRFQQQQGKVAKPSLMADEHDSREEERIVNESGCGEPAGRERSGSRKDSGGGGGGGRSLMGRLRLKKKKKLQQNSKVFDVIIADDAELMASC